MLDQDVQDKFSGYDSSLADIAIDVKSPQFGAKGDGTTDDTNAIITAEAAVYALGGNAKLLIPNGTYKITQPIKFRCVLDASQATFNYYGTGTAVVAGDDSASGIITYRKWFNLPRVVNMSRGTTGWDGTSIGYKCVNLNGCHVYAPFVEDFEYGLYVYGLGGGTAYSTFFLGEMWENHKNIWLDADGTGWVNQNLFLGGRLQQSTAKGGTVDDVNAWQIYMAGTSQPNNNTFINTSLEGDNISYYRLDVSGRNNYFYNCRWENTVNSGVSPRIRWRSSAYINKIEGGYNLVNVVETFDVGGSGGGELKDGYGSYTSATNTSGQSIPDSVWTTINTWATPVSRRCAYDGAGNFTPRAGRWKFSATICFSPNATGRRMARILTSGSITIDLVEVPANANRNSIKLEGVYRFDGYTSFKIDVQQTSGSALTLEPTTGYVRMQAEYLGYS